MNPQLATRFLLLAMLTMSLSKSDSFQLGSEADPIRRLFACQPMEVSVQGLKLDGRPGPFQTFADAVELAKAGRKAEAKTRLRSHSGSAKSGDAHTAMGLVSLVRAGGAAECQLKQGDSRCSDRSAPARSVYTLAGYQDGSARYLNFSGKAIFWDKPDASIKLLCERLIASTIPESSRAVPRKDTVLPKSGTQVTLLTRSGMYVIAEPPQSIMATGSALMLELIKRVNETEAKKP